MSYITFLMHHHNLDFRTIWYSSSTYKYSQYNFTSFLIYDTNISLQNCEHYSLNSDYVQETRVFLSHWYVRILRNGEFLPNYFILVVSRGLSFLLLSSFNKIPTTPFTIVLWTCNLSVGFICWFMHSATITNFTSLSLHYVFTCQFFSLNFFLSLHFDWAIDKYSLLCFLSSLSEKKLSCFLLIWILCKA